MVLGMEQLAADKLIYELKQAHMQVIDCYRQPSDVQTQSACQEGIEQAYNQLNTLSDVLHVWKRVHEFQASLSEPNKEEADSEVGAAFQQFLDHYDQVKDGQDYKCELEKAYESLKKDLYEKLYKPVESHKALRYISKEGNDLATFTYDRVTNLNVKVFQLICDCSFSQGDSSLAQIGVGDELGDYNLVKVLGEGGFGRVFLGEHFLDPQKKVAIKVLAKDRIGEEDVEEFSQEIENMARFDDKHIVRLLDFGRYGEIPFLVMEYASHGTLRKKVPSPRGPLQPLLERLNQEAWRCILHQQRVAEYVEQTASGLAEMHNKGRIHRDIKPENLLLRTEDEVVVGDLGLAARKGIKGNAGTYKYQAPEHREGKDCNPLWDVYGLAVTAHELLSGKRPRQGRGFRNMIRRLTLGDTSHISRKITSPQIRQLLAHALQTDPDKRFDGYVTDFAEELSRACQAQPQRRL